MPTDFKIRDDKNEYGTPISVHQCLACGHEFTVCPAQPDGVEFGGCQAPMCSSYDSSRDVDLLFEMGDVEIEEIGPGQFTIGLADDN